jgi:hypothetical protein
MPVYGLKIFISPDFTLSRSFISHGWYPNGYTMVGIQDQQCYGMLFLVV